jgi:type I restriction enzyme S subunit
MTQGDLLNNPVAMPDLDEQLDIAKYIDNQCDQIDELSAVVANSVTLLKEHRSALISAAVTGKIDVRGFDNKGAA